MPSAWHKYLSFNVVKYIELGRLTQLNKNAYKKIALFNSILIFIQNHTYDFFNKFL